MYILVLEGSFISEQGIFKNEADVLTNQSNLWA